MRLATLTAVLVGLLAAPAIATADSGSITNVSGSAGTITATVTVEATSCKDYGYGIKTCGWFATLTDQPANTDCAPYPGAPVWTSPYAAQSGTLTQTVSFRPYGTGDQTLCLYINTTAATQDIALARAAYTAPITAPPPAAPITVTPNVAISQAIRNRTGASPINLQNTCTPNGTAQICRTSWRGAGCIWAGDFTLGGQSADFDVLRASDSCLRRYTVKACSRPTSFVIAAPVVDVGNTTTAPTTTVSTTPANPVTPSVPTTTTFGTGQGTIGLCNDGTLSDSIGRQGACSHHGGVANP